MSYLQRNASRGARKTVSVSKSGIQRPTSQHQLRKGASTTGRRHPGSNESSKCKYFVCVMTLLLFAGAVAMALLYFYKQRQMLEKPNAVAVIREFMILQNESFKGKSDAEILDGAQHLVEYLSQLKSKAEEVESASNDIIGKLIGGWKPFSGSLYYFSSTALPFDRAKKTCEAQRAHLTDIISRAEEEFLEKETFDRGGFFFIGIQRANVWYWITDRPLTTYYWEKQPNPVACTPCCVMLIKCWTAAKCWKEVNCNQFRKFICKLEPDATYL